MRRPTSEDGMASMAVVILTAGVLAVSMGTLFTTTVVDQSQGANRVAQSQALNAAESGLDVAISDMQVTPSSLPCTLTGSLSSAPWNSSYSVTITYYATYPVTTSALSCATAQGGVTLPESAEVTSTGVDYGESATMDSLVTISVPQTTTAGSVFSNGVFTNSLQMNSAATLESSTNSANVYVGGSNTMNCDQSAVIDGSVTVQAAFTNQGCHIAGGVDAKGQVYLNSGSIGGAMISTTSSITAQGGTAISCFAYTTITVNQPAGACGSSPTQKDTALTGPAVQTFPPFTYTASQWTSAGWTVESTSNCNSSGSGNLQYDLSNLTGSTPTVIYTNCTGTLSLTGTFSLPYNVAVVTTGSINLNSNTVFKSSSSTLHDLYLMEPTSEGSGPNWDFDSGTQFTNLDVLIDFPGTFTMNSFATVPAMQVYAENEIMVDSAATINYVQLPTPPGVTGNGSGGTTTNGVATVGVVYEHQILGT